MLAPPESRPVQIGERLERTEMAVGVAERDPRGRLLIINVHGFGKADPLYAALAALGWETTVLDLTEPRILRWYAMARSFRPSLARWRARFEQTANRLKYTAFAFKYTSRRCGKMIRSSGTQYDLILQGGGMFAPGWPPPAGRYALICDCTVRLADGEPYSGVHFASPASARRWYALETMLYQKARAIFSTGDYVTRSFIGDFGVDPGRLLTVGEGCSLAAPSELHKTYNGKTILYVGYEFQRKGGEVLLSAFERVAAVMPDAELLVAGPRHIGRPLPPGVQHLGPVSRQQLSALYSQASVFVMPSLFEPFGLVFLEAMEHKLPCIGTDRCAMPEIIVDGETGLIVPAGDAAALAEKILYLLRRPELMRLMGERGRERVRRFFTWHAVAQRMDERLMEVLSIRSAAHEGSHS